jgi:hypothetical protein
MDKHELESAITKGIIKGGLVLALILIFIWLLLPTLIPILTLLLIEVSNKWREMLIMIPICVILFLFVYYLNYFSEDRYINYNETTFLGKIKKERFLDAEGKTTTLKLTYLFLGGGSLVIFSIFSLAFLTMKRASNNSDIVALCSCIVGFIVFSYLAFKKKNNF